MLKPSGGALLFQSRVARRIFTKFVLCALGPFALIAGFTLYQVSSNLTEEAYRRLHRSNKDAGVHLVERLQYLEELLAPAASMLNSGSADSIPPLHSSFIGCLYLTADAKVLGTWGEVGRVPHWGPDVEAHLAEGRAAVVTVSAAGGRPVDVCLLVPVGQAGATRLAAIIDPSYLWQGEVFQFRDGNLAVLDSDGETLYASAPVAVPPDTGERPAGGGVVRFRWMLGDETYLADSRGLFLRPLYATGWTLIRSQSEAEVLAPLARLQLLTGLVAGLSFLVVLLLSKVQIRRSLVPLRQLQEATQAIRLGDLSVRLAIGDRDEFSEVGQSFNEMTGGLEEYLHGTSVLQRISRDLSAVTELEELYRLVVTGARELAHAAGTQLFLTRPDEPPELCGEEFTGVPYEPATAACTGSSGSNGDLISAVAEGGQCISLPDIRAQHRYAPGPYRRFEERCGVAVAAVLAMPLVERQGEVLGVLHLVAPAAGSDGAGVGFSATVQRLLEALAAQAATALIRARLAVQLLARERLYRGLVENSPAAICIHDRDGVLSYVNPAWADGLGMEPRDLVGRPLGQLLDIKDQPGYQQYLGQVGIGATYQTVFHPLTRAGDLRTWSYRGVGQVSERGEYQVIGHAQDLTEQRELEESLAHAEKLQAVGALAGGIAHDFNNILTPILLGAELALMDVPADGKTAQNLNRIVAAGRRAQGLVEQILTFSRRREGGRSLVAMHVLVGEVVKLLQATLPASIEIEVSIDRTTDVVVADGGQLHQVLMNLCTNARHAMHPRGGVLGVELEPVEVSVASPGPVGLEPGPYVRLAVTDTGKGIAPEVRERIFEPFFTTKGVGEGTGLGLSIVHGIVADHGGVIHFESALGEGSRFEVWLPRVDAPVADSMQVVEEVVRGSGQTVLFLDDREEIARVAEAMLSSLGYTPVVFQEPQQALAAFSSAPDRFDLVISDQDMPGMTGIAFAARVSDIRPGVPFILCAGVNGEALEQQAAEAPIARLCPKPLTLTAMAAAIHRALHPLNPSD